MAELRRDGEAVHRRAECARNRNRLMILNRCLLAGISLLWACSSVPDQQVKTRLSVADQTGAFRTAVQHVTEENRPVRVEPRPIVVSYGPVPPNEDDLMETDREVVGRRTRVIRNLGLKAGNVFPMRTSCSGVLAPPGNKETSGCPEQTETELVFGLLRREGPERWTLPMVELAYRPSGKMMTIHDLTLKRRDGSWEVSGRDERVVFE